MSRTSNIRWAVLIVFNAFMWTVLSFQQTTNGAPRADNEPFANSVAQRMEMNALLKEINAELKIQTALLQSGKLTVIVADQNKR